MMRYLFDTNIILIYAKGEQKATKLENEYAFFNQENRLYISVTSIAELKSLILQRNYGDKKIKVIEEILAQFVIVDINVAEILNRYAEIDAYSQGKLRTNPSSFSSRNMGKNDLYIVATSSVYDLTLVTTDKDFDHLNKTYLKLLYIDQTRHNN